MTSIASTALSRTRRTDVAIACWLLACAALVFAMAVIGAVTRLTESGLSMAEWRPLVGAVPPLSDGEWQRVFDLYRETPEYRLKNAGMTLDAFRHIFFWEMLHRLWGRLIGVVFAVPFLWFWLRGRIARPLLPRLAGLLVLGALQGLLGWYMVRSGLVDRPSVSHYRLAAHLGLAFLIYGLLLWQAMALLAPARPSPPPAADGLVRHAWVALALLAAAVLWGALVAGLDAGLAYNSFPLMNGALLPDESWILVPAWRNLFDNTALVQFAHRWLALATTVAVLALWLRGRRADVAWRARQATLAAGLMALVQVALGIATLLLAVPIAVAAAHQAGALLLAALLLWSAFELAGGDVHAGDRR